MKVYKKLFRYVPDNKLIGYLAIIISGISAFFMVYGYYYIYKFFDEIIVKGNYENAGFHSTRIVFFFTLIGRL